MSVAEHPDAFGPRRLREDIEHLHAAFPVGHESDMRALIGADARVVRAVEQAFAGDSVSRHRRELCHEAERSLFYR